MPEDDISTTATEPSFAELLESYSSRITRDIRSGDKLSGRIISIEKDMVFLDTGTQTDGVAVKSELLNEQGEFSYRVGDTLELYVVSADEDVIHLSRSISGAADTTMLKDAFHNAVPVSGKVTAQCKGGFHVDIHHIRAFCPISQIDVSYVENPEVFIGNTYEFLILQFEENGKNIVISRRELLKQAIEIRKQAFLETLSVGAICTGKISRIMPYGAFIELVPGLTGLLPISEISWSHIEKPEDVLTSDDTLQVVVTAIQPRDGDDPKISLSVKQALDNPWTSVHEKFHVGDRVKGKVNRLTHFGAFVEIAPGIDGLVHISEISYTKRVNRVEDFLTTGDTVYVMIKEIDLIKRRISLSIKDAEGDPWMDASEKFKPGQSVEGILQKKEKWGHIITLLPGITGILPISAIRSSEQAASVESLKPGRALTVVVDTIKPEERSITLRMDTPENGNWQQYTPARQPLPMGTLGDKLQEALSRTQRKK